MMRRICVDKRTIIVHPTSQLKHMEEIYKSGGVSATVSMQKASPELDVGTCE